MVWKQLLGAVFHKMSKVSAFSNPQSGAVEQKSLMWWQYHTTLRRLPFCFSDPPCGYAFLHVLYLTCQRLFNCPQVASVLRPGSPTLGASRKHRIRVERDMFQNERQSWPCRAASHLSGAEVDLDAYERNGCHGTLTTKYVFFELLNLFVLTALSTWVWKKVFCITSNLW